MQSLFEKGGKSPRNLKSLYSTSVPVVIAQSTFIYTERSLSATDQGPM